MTIWVLTLFPKVFEGFLKTSIIKRAQEKKLLVVNLVDIRTFAKDKHKTVDDKPYGGGSGMVLRVDIIVSALESIKPKPYLILLSASGKKYAQLDAQKLSRKKNVALICGHYEGIDARIEKYVDEIYSVGDFVMTGGEVAAMAVIDSTARLIPSVIKEQSLQSESFSEFSTLYTQIPTLLEYPQFTRPEIFRGQKVPEVLLSGNHSKIATWRQKKAIKRTREFRRDLVQKF